MLEFYIWIYWCCKCPHHYKSQNSYSVIKQPSGNFNFCSTGSREEEVIPHGWELATANSMILKWIKLIEVVKRTIKKTLRVKVLSHGFLSVCQKCTLRKHMNSLKMVFHNSSENNFYFNSLDKSPTMHNSESHMQCYIALWRSWSYLMPGQNA